MDASRGGRKRKTMEDDDRPPHRGRGGRHHSGGRGTGRGGGGRNGKHRSNNRRNGSASQSKRHNRSRAAAAGASAANLKSEESSSADDAASAGGSFTVLPWPFPDHIPVAEEERLLADNDKILIHWGKNERGMWLHQPQFRMKKIMRHLRASRDSTPQLTLTQALSLRRHHMKLLNPRLNMEQLKLGSFNNIKAAADVFETVIEDHLRSLNVNYMNEHEQRKKFKPKPPLTPDFLIKGDCRIKLSIAGKSAAAGENEKLHPFKINFIEVKMFYGASTIPAGTPNAVGTILPKMQKYVERFGTGAIIFMYGFGVELAEQLNQVGVLALDARHIDLTRVEQQQRSWCTDKKGTVLF